MSSIYSSTFLANKFDNHNRRFPGYHKNATRYIYFSLHLYVRFLATVIWSTFAWIRIKWERKRDEREEHDSRSSKERGSRSRIVDALIIIIIIIIAQ